MMMRADEEYTAASEGCSMTELLACFGSSDISACMAACNGEAEEPEEDVLPGYATVSTKAEATQSVALNAVEKKIGTVTLKAGDNDTTVTSIEITKAGLGLDKDIAGIQLMKDGEYVTNQVTNLSNKKATLRFTPKLVIKANKSETFDVVVSMNALSGAGGQFDFSVTAVTVANGTFGGTPARLGSLTVINYEVGKIDVKTLNGNTSLNAGDEEAEIVTVTVQPKVEAKVSSITLTSIAGAGTLKDELNKKFSNVKAYVDDEVVGSVTVSDETITIAGLNETVKANRPLDVVLKGDIIYVGEDISTTDPITLTVKDNHVNAVETNTNERMQSTNSAGNATIAIAGLDLTLKNLQKQAQTVAPGTAGVVLMDLELVAGADLEVQNFTITPTNFVPADFEEEKVTLYVDGINYDVTTAAAKTFNAKDEFFTVSAGDKIKVQVVGDFVDNANASNINFDFRIDTVKNIETNKIIGSTVATYLNIHQKGHNTTVKSSKPTLKDTKVNTSNLLKEGETSDVLGFSVKASNEKTTLKSLTFKVSNISAIKEIALYKEGTTSPLVTKDADDFDSSNNVTMTLAQSINADATAKYVLKATLEDGNVVDLGTPITFKLTNTTYTTPSITTPATLTDVITSDYQIAAEEPTVEAVKDGNKINVTITNNSSYDLDGITFSMKVIGEIVDGENLLEKTLLATSDGGVWTIKDSNDNDVTATVSYASNIFEATFALTVDANGSEEFTVVMPEKATIRSEYYTATVKSLKFKYADDDLRSAVVTAKYNSAAASEVAQATQTTNITVAGKAGTTPAAWGTPTAVDSTALVVAGNKISGTVAKVTGTPWTAGFLANATHVIRLEFTLPTGVSYDDVQVGINSLVTLDSDKDAVFAISDTTKQLKVVYNGITDYYDLSDLVLAD